MDYIKNNKAAWEEAFECRRQNWGDNNYKVPYWQMHMITKGIHCPLF